MTDAVGSGFSELVRPLGPDAFLAEVSGRAPRHFPGDPARFQSLFSFAEMNRLLGMWRLWTDRTFKVVLDGRDVPSEEFCVAGQDRQGNPAMLVDGSRVEALLTRGATVVLDVMESLSPAVRRMAHTLQSALGGTVVCNVYCSFEAHAGFPSHYDTTDVFALHIDGVKRWRVYQGRADRPVERPGHSYAWQSREHHDRAKGPALMEVEMTPGDVLYLPRGQYHDALAQSGASLHLSFGITRPTALDFMGVLGESLPDDPLFREELPHFDSPQAVAGALSAVGRRLQELASDPQLAAQVCTWQRERVFRDLPPAMGLPARDAQTRVRIRRGARVSYDGTALTVSGHPVELAAPHHAVVTWMLSREIFLASELISECAMPEADARALLEHLSSSGLIEPV